MAHAEKNMAAYDNRKHAGTVNKAELCLLASRRPRPACRAAPLRDLRVVPSFVGYADR